MNSEERLHATYNAFMGLKSLYHKFHNVNNEMLDQMDTLDAMLQGSISHVETTMLERKRHG